MNQIEAGLRRGGQPAEDQLQRAAARLAARGGKFGDNASPGAQKARKLVGKMRSPADGNTPRRAEVVARVKAQTDHDARTCHDYWNHCLAHEGVAPRAAGHRPTDERNLALRFDRLRTKARHHPADLSGEAQRLLRRVQAEIGPLAVVLQREQEAAQVSKDFADDHGVNGLLRHAPRAQKQMGPGDSHCGSSPFPWFVNVGHACYLDTVVTCLFHCSAPRQHLAAMPPATELLAALQDSGAA